MNDAQAAFEDYREAVYGVAEDVADELRGEESYNSMDGREWCEDHGVPEQMFADALEWFVDGAEWGVSPMYPWPSQLEEEINVIEFSRESEEEPVDSEEEDGEE